MILPKELEKLKQFDQWVVYKLEKRPTKDDPEHLGKVPYDPKTGLKAKADDPTTWSNYETAAAAVDTGKYAGIGIEFSDNLLGVDLDKVINEKGQLKNQAAEIIRSMDSYAEKSPSGTGIHILAFGRKPDGRCKVKNADGTEYEMYDSGRFFTITGNAIYKKEPIEATAQAAEIHKKYWPQEAPAVDPTQKPAQKAPSVDLSPSYQTWLDYSKGLSDTELLESIFKSGIGKKVEALFNGDMSAYNNDHSRADQALVCYLYNFTADLERTDALFRMSALCRDSGSRSGNDNKWNREDYRRRAFKGATDCFIEMQGYIEFTADQKREYAKAMDARRAFEAEPEVPAIETEPAGEEVQPEEEKKPRNPQPHEVTKYIVTGLFNTDLEKFRQYKDRKTGYRNIDSITSLYPGLYALGAISSLGKTTFALQMADQLAEAGEHVLFFSLEQTRAELVSKSLSRILMQARDIETASAINIRRGYYDSGRSIASNPSILEDIICIYNRMVGGKLSIVELNFRSTVEHIRKYIEAYIVANGVTPVVFIDYLQILSCEDKNLTDKQRTDYIVEALKNMQKQNDLTLIVISSLNRQNYLIPVDFESFKESGGIEYTADVVWGLELQVLQEDIFNKEGKLKEKREKVKQAKRENPRKVLFSCLKNRYGIANYSCGFSYYPQFDYFVPEDEFSPVLDDSYTPFAI